MPAARATTVAPDRRGTAARARRSGFPLLAALVLLGLAAAWGADRSRRDFFTTADEPDHVRACRELRSGPGVVSNFEHPVLMKVLGAAGLPRAAERREIDEVRAARRLFPVVFGLLAFVAGLWASRRSDAAAGLAVAALVALEPTLRGHAPLVHTDVLLTTLLVVAAALLDLSGPPGRPRLPLLVLSGAAYGLALAAKYSALPFLPVFLAAAALRLRGTAKRPEPPARAGRRDRRTRPPAAPEAGWPTAMRRAAVAVALPALLTGLLVQQAVVASTTAKSDLLDGIARKFEGYPGRLGLLKAASSLPRGIAAYVAGLTWVRVSSVPGARFNYFLGEVSGRGRLLYFPVALAVKLTTAAVLALVAAALLAAATALRPRGPGRRRRLRLLAARSLLPFLLGAAYLGAAMLADVNIGVRHVAPSIPFFLVAAAGVLRTAGRGIVRPAIAVAVVALAALEALHARGREIPFGNLLVGGPPGVRRVLSDSNVDWGERLDRAFARAARGDLGRVGVVSLFWDEDAARAAGVERVFDRLPAGLDTLVVSAFLWDLGPPLERTSETGPKWVYFRERFAAFLKGVRDSAPSPEPFLDEYVIVRLRPSPSPPAPTR